MEPELEDSQPESTYIFTFDCGRKYGLETGEGLIMATLAACMNTGKKDTTIVKVERTI